MPHLPDDVLDHLTEIYRQSHVILEYGSGGSTELAAGMPGKYIMSVESDRSWARELRGRIAKSSPRSPVVVHHVDIGPTGSWGRPIDHSGWKKYHRYPNEIWDCTFFRHPDTVLIDGRFRTACLATLLLRIEKPVVALFDDYVERPAYHSLERIVTPARVIGRMAEFRLEPGMVRPGDTGLLIEQYFFATVVGEGLAAYQLPETGIRQPV